MKYYCIACSPRSGTHLLMSLLKQQGCGNPGEYFYRIGLGEEFSHINSLEKLYQEGTLNNIFGVAIHRIHVENGMKRLRDFMGIPEISDYNLLNKAFPNIKFIYLYRMDKIKQAVSLKKAARTGNFVNFKKGLDYGEYSEEELTEHLSYLCKEQSHWLKFFDEHGIDPHYVTYEELCKDPVESVRRILDFLELDSSNIRIEEEHLPKRHYNKFNRIWYTEYISKNIRILRKK